jgi:hypothetical protein
MPLVVAAGSADVAVAVSDAADVVLTTAVLANAALELAAASAANLLELAAAAAATLLELAASSLMTAASASKPAVMVTFWYMSNVMGPVSTPLAPPGLEYVHEAVEAERTHSSLMAL